MIMATDGLFDNVTEKQILDIANSLNVGLADFLLVSSIYE